MAQISKDSESTAEPKKTAVGLIVCKAIFATIVALIAAALWPNLPLMAGSESSIWFWLFVGTSPIVTIGCGILAWLFIDTFASLKLTVLLLMLATFMVWVATMQQTRMDIWDVKRQHFGEYTEHGFLPNLFVYMPVDHFNAPAWQKENHRPWRFGLWLPSGLTVMVLLMLNLTAAHLVRFKIKTTPIRFLTGSGILVLGLIVTGMIIWISQSPSEIQGRLPAAPATMWKISHFGLFLIALVPTLMVFLAKNINLGEKIVLGGLGVSLFALLLGMVFIGEGVFGESGMRILWQLFQASVAGILLLIGCLFIFSRRGGIVLLHCGIGLMMVNEIFVSLTNVEQRMTLLEGETGSVAVDVRSVEFVVYDADNEEAEDGVVIPSRFFRNGEFVNHDLLPINFQFQEYYKNAEVTTPQRSADFGRVLATEGIGRELFILPQSATTGVDSDQTVDIPAGYVKIFDKQDDEIGLFLVSEQLYSREFIDKFQVDGKNYHLALRLKRIEKPYALTLIDVTKEDYVGTDTPKHYGSEFLLTDLKRGNKQIRQTISMNNPLRFGNDTFYQSGFHQIGDQQLSILQIVKNEGWMIPYLACMFVVIGMSAQLVIILRRHLKGEVVTRSSQPANPESAAEFRAVAVESAAISRAGQGSKDPSKTGNPGSERPGGNQTKQKPQKQKSTQNVELAKRNAQLPPLMGDPTLRQSRVISSGVSKLIVIIGAVLIGLLAAALLLMGARTNVDKDGFDMSRFGQIPVTQNGRVMPMDTLARNTLRKLSRREAPKEKGRKKGADAIKWYADAIFEKDGWKKHRVYRVDDPNVRHALNLDRRKGYTYSEAELENAEDALNQAIREQQQERGDSTATSSYEQRLSEIYGKRGSVRMLIASAIDIPADEKPTGASVDQYLSRMVPSLWQMLKSQDKASRRSDLPNLVSVSSANLEANDQDWAMLTLVNLRRWVDHQRNDENENEFDLATRFADTYYFPQLRKEMIREAILRQLMSLDEIRESRENFSDAELRADLNDYLDKMDPKKYQEFAARVAGPIDLTLMQRREPKISEFALSIEHLYEMTNLDDLDAAYAIADRFGKMRKAYVAGNAKRFNELVEEHHQEVVNAEPAGFNKNKNRVETLMNSCKPFFVSKLVYIFALVFGIGGWIFLSPTFRRLSFWVIGIAVAVQTLGLIARIYVSGRPPVTNLYSSAIFVGWIGAVGCLGLEIRHRMGLGNVLAAFGGLWTILIAESLSQQGDTIGVMQAVLDTNFWLATHVVIIAMGYAGTFLAGFLGALYLLSGICTPHVNRQMAKSIESQIHLVTCWSLLLSFFGTVLGGLWADDSWGRFWGWDPKENGALMIVLWNAVVLHARWGGVVKGRGLAALAAFGAIVVSWSWFAVNELNVGLHQYGATEGRMEKLAVFWIIQFGICLLALIPVKYWWSHRANLRPVAIEAVPVADKVPPKKT